MATLGVRRRLALDETFDPGQTAHYNLIITPSPQGVMMVVHDAVRMLFIGAVSQPWTAASDRDWYMVLTQLADDFPWLRGSFRSVRLAWEGAGFTLVPPAYFQPNRAKVLLSSLVPVSGLDAIYANVIDEATILVCGIPSELINAARKFWAQPIVLHMATGLARFALHNFRKQPGLLIHLGPQTSTLTLVRQGQVLAQVPFVAQTAEDVLYRVISLVEAYDLTVSGVVFRTCGPGQQVAPDPLGTNEEILSPQAVDPLLGQYLKVYDGRLQFENQSFSYLLGRELTPFVGLYALMACE